MVGTEDHAGWDAICEVLPKSAVKVFKVSSSQLNPKAITKLASILATAGLVRVDISGNSIGSDGGKALISVLPSSSIKSLKIGRSFEISTEKYEESVVDCSKQDFGPGEVIVLSWWLSTEVTAGVGTVDLSNNRFDPSLLDGIKHKVKLDVTGCRA